MKHRMYPVTYLPLDHRIGEFFFFLKLDAKGLPSCLDRALAHRIRVIGGCVVWVRSRNDTVASATSSAQRLLHDLRQWSVAPW